MLSGLAAAPFILPARRHDTSMGAHESIERTMSASLKLCSLRMFLRRPTDKTYDRIMALMGKGGRSSRRQRQPGYAAALLTRILLDCKHSLKYGGDEGARYSVQLAGLPTWALEFVMTAREWIHDCRNDCFGHQIIPSGDVNGAAMTRCATTIWGGGRVHGVAGWL